MVDVVWLSYEKETPARGYWDHALLEDLFDYKFWKPVNGQTFKHTENIDEVKADGCVIVFPARAQLKHAKRLNTDLQRFRWVVLFITGDEEALFAVDKIKHPNIKIWVMSPRLKHKKYGKLPNGYTPHVRFLKEIENKDKTLDYFFAGQVTHSRRENCVEALKDIPNGEVIATESFTAGIEPSEYMAKMAQAKLCPCPSGPETPDTFRLYETLEAGAIPIADEQTPKKNFKPGYFTYLFESEPPFPVLKNYDSLPGYIVEALQDYKAKANKVFAWWLQYKRKLAYQISDDIENLSGIAPARSWQEKITVLIPTSPIPSMPGTDVLDECVASVRKNIPDCEIIIMFDGMRDNLKHYKDKYEEYTRRVIWKCNHEWKNVLPVIFSEHEHQANMTRDVLGAYVTTPTILFVEHDAPPVVDCNIEWASLIENVMNGEANIIRLHHEALILPEHEYLMFDHENVLMPDWKGLPHEVPMRRTMQWSQRPHVASVIFYKNMLERYFPYENKTMIEDVVHGRLIEACKDGLLGWFDWRVWVYTPAGDNIKRSYHIDGRKNDPKY